jgi:hypothetical protein
VPPLGCATRNGTSSSSSDPVAGQSHLPWGSKTTGAKTSTQSITSDPWARPADLSRPRIGTHALRALARDERRLAI